jgi:hypothetical protein
MRNERWIIGINVTDRVNEAEKVQATLTKFGCSIKTRLGLHEVTNNYCDEGGLILVELTGDLVECEKLENELRKIEKLEVQKMVFKQA